MTPAATRSDPNNTAQVWVLYILQLLGSAAHTDGVEHSAAQCSTIQYNRCSIPPNVITMTDHTPDSPFFPQLEPIAARYWSSTPYVSGWSMLEFCRSTRAGRFHGTPLGGGVWAGPRLMRGELFDPHFLAVFFCS